MKATDDDDPDQPTQPPMCVPIAAAVENLRERVAHARYTLGVSYERIARAADLSPRALRKINLERWDPSLKTLVKLDDGVTKTMARWVTERDERDQRLSDDTEPTTV